MIRSALAAVLLAAVSAGVSAQSAVPGVDARQAAQDARIDRGAATGQLTPREAARLDRGQARVDAVEGRALADGAVTGRERARLHVAQDVESRRILAQRHDRQRDRNHDGRIDRPVRR